MPASGSQNHNWHLWRQYEENSNGDRVCPIHYRGVRGDGGQKNCELVGGREEQDRRIPNQKLGNDKDPINRIL